MQGILTFNLEPLFCLYKKERNSIFETALKGILSFKEYFIIIDSPSSQERYITEVPVLFRCSLGKGNQDSWKRFRISFMLKGGRKEKAGCWVGTLMIRAIPYTRGKPTYSFYFNLFACPC